MDRTTFLRRLDTRISAAGYLLLYLAAAAVAVAGALALLLLMPWGLL